MKIQEYSHTDGLRRWELLYEGVYLVLLNSEAPKPYSSQLLAFNGFGPLIWYLSPMTEQGHDYIVNVWVKNNELFAGSFTGYSHKIDIKTGKVIETKFTK